MDIQHTIFISYRRTNKYIALSVYQYLRERSYDVFLDTESLPPGDWKRALTDHISARAHFLPILTPSALERCVNPDDVLRFEIELAIERQRNIVPLMFEGFDFGKVDHLLSPTMKVLPKYNGMRVPDDFFEAAMQRLCDRFLSLPLDVVLHPLRTSTPSAESLPAPTPEQRQAEEAFERGVRAFNDGRTAESITHFSRALELNPAYVDAYWERGSSHYSLDQRDAALDDWLDAARMGADDPRIHLFWSYIYMARQDTRRALEEAGKMIARHPNDPVVYVCRGDIHKDFGDCASAIIDYDAALRINTDYGIAYSNRGQCRLNLGDHAGAEADETEAIRINPNDVFAYLMRGHVRYNLGNYDGALADYAEVLKHDPESGNALQGRGVVYYTRGEYAAALTAFNQALAINPLDAMGLYNRANTYEQMGDETAALFDLRHYVAAADQGDPDTLAEVTDKIRQLETRQSE